MNFYDDKLIKKNILYSELEDIRIELMILNKQLSFSKYDVGLRASQKEVFKRFATKSNELASMNMREDTKEKYLIKEKRTSRQESS